MSGRLVSAVLDSALPAWLKRYAAAYASFAADDGSRVYPSRARVSRLVGRSERSTQRAIQELRRRGVLALEQAPAQNRAPRYAFRALALPQIGDPDQLPLFSTGGVPKPGAKPADPDVFHSHPQVLTGHRCLPGGDMGVSRSVIDPSFSTSTRRDARKTGTED